MIDKKKELKLRLKEALGVLSKSSKYSVSTLKTEQIVDDLQSLKDYLYIPPQIQYDFEKALDDAVEQSLGGNIICLCGSSGDGKSEILTKLYKKFSGFIDFHLDATHSSQQHRSAIDCLDERFDEFKENSKSLAIGINVGMLQKFIKQGAERHDDIKSSFEAYFTNRHMKGYRHKNVSFYDFECYPRLSFSEQTVTSSFISDFLKKLTEPSIENPFYEYYLLEEKTDSKVARNFEVLSLLHFQNKLIELFCLARLLEEQFLIPRIFVDFIFQIVTKEHEDGIIGNVFSDLDNEFSQCFRRVDPINYRSAELDCFYLEYATNTLSENMAYDISQLNTVTGCSLSPQGLVRGAYLLNGHNLKSTLPNFYKDSYLQIALKHYLRLVSVYEAVELSVRDEDDCLNIIEDLILKSLLEYANRQLPVQVDGYIVSRKLNEYSVCNKINIQADIEWIKRHQLISNDIIPIPLIINNEPVYTFNLDLKTLVQAVYISNGFRPNMQNIEAIAKFEELLAHIVDRTLESESLKLVSRDKTVSINKNRQRFTVEV
ncbi:DNA phosphorothioation-dependent restriction protein DptF [Shewanella sp. NKUCC01_JLK]|uniref:DNA phosphorothioation-dependent restriction protein DptF n=1 Tax=Shewanella sp. NKUCC01_JLK TaxID=2842123 RepID=UPI001C5BD9EE|nr:DNA phosphorothioation-dependent restriction protein DptF [Shewanella sp. NKUCC01_JLK]MBW3513356.1 DNA phosphorothioation-dependent restriction protein DptF [Shewanella sp. NKUCC01_JLK]